MVCRKWVVILVVKRQETNNLLSMFFLRQYTDIKIKPETVVSTFVSQLILFPAGRLLKAKRHRVCDWSETITNWHQSSWIHPLWQQLWLDTRFVSDYHLLINIIQTFDNFIFIISGDKDHSVEKVIYPRLHIIWSCSGSF